MLHGLAAYLLAAMSLWAPPSVHDYTKTPRAETEARYESIASDLATVALDPDEVPLFAGGEIGRAQTALVMLAIASYESGQFRSDVDRQDKPTGDGGHAWCIAQLHDEEPSHYARGLTDRVSCFRGMLRALRRQPTASPATPLATANQGNRKRGDAWKEPFPGGRSTRTWRRSQHVSSAHGSYVYAHSCRCDNICAFRVISSYSLRTRGR